MKLAHEKKRKRFSVLRCILFRKKKGNELASVSSLQQEILTVIK